MKPEELDRLRQTHSPQPTGGRVSPGLHIAKDGNLYRIWDSRQTSGYLCSAPLPILLELLYLEEQSQGAVRTLITGEPSPFNLNPPHPTQATFSGPAKINLEDLLS